jgi:pimeloyl-ACP methyl ester carboxylesterase
MQPEAVELAAPGGLALRGVRWGDGPSWAVLVHAPTDEDLDAWLDLPSLLAERAYAVLAYDLPGHGLSDTAPDREHLVASVQVALAWAQAAGARRRFLIAAGASVPAALLAARDEPFDALVGLSPLLDPAQYEDIRTAVMPKLLFVGARERQALAHAEQTARLAVGWTVLSRLPVLEQGTRLLESAWGERLREQTLAFLADYRLDPSTP